MIRPGGLSEDDSRAASEGVVYSGADQQESSSLPRLLVALACLDALETPAAIGKIVEITSSANQEPQPLAGWLARQLVP